MKKPCSNCEQDVKHIVSGAIDAGCGEVRVRPTGERSFPARKR